MLSPYHPDNARDWFADFGEPFVGPEFRPKRYSGVHFIPILQGRNIPLDAFGYLLLDVPPEFPNLKAFFPSMAPDAVQDTWTGNHGISLLQQSAAFMRTLVSGYEAITGHAIEDATVLDYGCGWGRLIRLLYKYVAHEQIYAVDPWDKSIEVCREHGIKAHLALSEYVTEVTAVRPPVRPHLRLLCVYSSQREDRSRCAQHASRPHRRHWRAA